MNVRTLLLSGVLASGLTLTVVPEAAADRPPWAGAWDHPTFVGGDQDKSGRNYYWRDRNGDQKYNRNDPPYRNDRNYRGNDPQYSKLAARVNHDRAKIAQIERAGGHHKALRWYKDDLRNAERDVRNYRGQRTSNGRDYDYDHDSSDRYDDDSSYNGGDDGSFGFDWPDLFGKLLNPTR